MLLPLSNISGMLSGRNVQKITFEPERIIQPIFTGGDVALDVTGRILVSCLGEDAIFTDLNTGRFLARIDGVRDHHVILEKEIPVAEG